MNTIKSVYVRGRYYDNEYIIKYNYCVLNMIRKRDNFIITTFIDIDDIDRCKEYIWYPHHDKNKPDTLIYVRHKDMYRLHRFIMNLDDPNLVVDHIDRNPLNNRKENLRVCTVSDNNKNISKYRNNKSGYTGIHWDKYKNKYIVKRMINYKLYIKLFNNLNDAIEYRKYLETL